MLSPIGSQANFYSFHVSKCSIKYHEVPILLHFFFFARNFGRQNLETMRPDPCRFFHIVQERAMRLRNAITGCIEFRLYKLI